MKKFFVFLCFAVFCGVFFGSNVYAANLTIDDKNVNVDFVGPYKYVRYEDSAGQQRLAVFGNFQLNSGEDEPYLTITVNDSKTSLYITVNVKQANYCLYKLENNAWVVDGNWSYKTKGQSLFVNSAVEKFHESSYVITLSDGTPVFPEPPAETPVLEEIMKTEMPVVAEKTTETMKTIALCGAGCLALLIGLVILPKVLYKFL